MQVVERWTSVQLQKHATTDLIYLSTQLTWLLVAATTGRNY